MSPRALNILGLAAVGITGLLFLVLTPRLAELDVVLELTIYMIMAILALSLALIWGYGGILCFGQSAFFGLGAYTYAIAMFNIGESTVPLLLAIIGDVPWAWLVIPVTLPLALPLVTAVQTGAGKGLIPVLVGTSRLTFYFAAVFAMGIIL